MIGDVICQHVNKATVLDVQRNDGDKCDLDGSYDSPPTILSHMSINIYIQIYHVPARCTSDLWFCLDSYSM